MKMSRSIKDYKDAMDGIKISDSFYKRTETLLNDLADDDGEKRPFFMSRKITVGVMAAAACVVCLIGVRLVLDLRTDNLESASETSLTRISAETVTEVVTTPVLIDEIEDEEEAFEGIAAAGDISEDAYDDFSAETDQAAAVPADNGDDIPVADVPAAYDINSIDPPVVMTIPTDEAEHEGYPEINAEGTDNIPGLTSIVPENIKAEITPYFDMGDITSGEITEKSGDEIAGIIGMIKGIPSVSKKIQNDGFVSLFSVQLYDNETGDIFYSIYITDDGNAVITKHSSPQERTTYSLAGANYESLKKSLFLLFGEESDYALFENLVSGR